MRTGSCRAGSATWVPSSSVLGEEDPPCGARGTSPEGCAVPGRPAGRGARSSFSPRPPNWSDDESPRAPRCRRSRRWASRCSTSGQFLGPVAGLPRAWWPGPHRPPAELETDVAARARAGARAGRSAASGQTVRPAIAARWRRSRRWRGPTRRCARGLALAGRGAVVAQASARARLPARRAHRRPGHGGPLRRRGRRPCWRCAAGRALLLDRERVAEAEARAGMSVVGVAGSRASIDVLLVAGEGLRGPARGHAGQRARRWRPASGSPAWGRADGRRRRSPRPARGAGHRRRGDRALGRLPALWSRSKALQGQLAVLGARRVLVLIDFPEFNMRLARTPRPARRPRRVLRGPQLWAWRPRRIHAMARDVSRVLSGLPVRGRSLPGGRRARGVRQPSGAGRPAGARPRRGAPELAAGRGRCVGLLPGSGDAARSRHLARAARGGAAHHGASAEDALRAPGGRTIGGGHRRTRARLASSGRRAARRGYRVMARRPRCWSPPGTATLEAACYGAPMVVLYRLRASRRSPAGSCRGVSHISLPNIIAGREIVPGADPGRGHAGAVAAAGLDLLETRSPGRLGWAASQVRPAGRGRRRRAPRAVLSRERHGAGGH